MAQASSLLERLTGDEAAARCGMPPGGAGPIDPAVPRIRQAPARRDGDCFSHNPLTESLNKKAGASPVQLYSGIAMNIALEFTITDATYKVE